MEKTRFTRLLSLLLTAVMMLGLVVVAAPEAQAAEYDTTVYAPPATAEEIAAVPRWFAGNDGAGATGSFMKVVNGEIYAWGANTSGVLGPVSNAGELVLEPTKIPRSYFNDEDVVLMKMSLNGAGAVTSSGQIYVWGATLPVHFGGKSGQTTPLAIDMGDLGTAIGNGATVKTFTHTAHTIFVEDSNGVWYTAGNGSSGISFQLNSATLNKMTKLPEALYTNFIWADGNTNRKIIQMGASHMRNGYLLTDDGKVWVVGANSGEHQSGLGHVVPANAPECLNIPGEPLNGIQIVSMASEDQGWIGVDSNGDVWAYGSSNHYRFGKPEGFDDTGKDLGAYNQSPNIEKPTKIYDHLAFNGGIKKKAVAVGLSYYHAYVLAEDNTVYAMGYNTNSMITNNTASLQIPEMTQTLKSVSESDTIVGFVINNTCAMAVTKSGDMLFVGSNASGGAGTGNTESAPGGEPSKVEPPTLPPSEPQTANEVIFEIQTEDGVTYRTDPSDSTGNTLLKTENKTTTKVPYDSFAISAGKVVKLNVYFRDFGKLGSFYMPIRFDPTLLQVVNSAGKPYTNAANSVASISSLSGSGIAQCFTSQNWSGGYLVVGSKVNTYPKICNTDGWISIAGYSDDPYASITGEVKMFSIDFMVQHTGTLRFDFATDQNVPAKGSSGGPILGAGYDEACDALVGNHYGPYWLIRNPKAENLIGMFSFNLAGSPKFKTQYVPVTSIKKLYVTYGSGSGMTKIEPKAEDGKVHINWNNSETIYTVWADTDPENASFPSVTWTYELDTSGRTDGRTAEDFISIVNTADTYIQFKMVDNANFQEGTDEPADLIFNATSVDNSSKSNSVTVHARSFEAPGAIKIAEKTTYNTDTFIYHYRFDDSKHTNDAPTKFTVDFGLPDGALPENPDVQWKLMDQDRNEIDLTNPNVKINLAGVVSGGGSGKNEYYANVNPCYTTPDGTYLILRVESVIDPSVGDEVILKAQMYVSALEFSQETLRIAVDSERDLSQLLDIAPMDVYETDLEWSIIGEPDAEHIPANWDSSVHGDYDPTNPPLYATLRNTTLSSYEWGTPRNGYNTMNEDDYVVVQVQDKNSGESAFIKVQILALNCPIPITDFEVKNELGYANDVLIIKSGLQEGDILKIYKTYDDATPAITTTELTKAQIPNGYGIFSLALNDTSGVLSGDSGEIAVELIRKVGDSPQTFDRVPVPYNAEPSKVQGYVRLLGRETYSEFNEGIRVYLSGTKYQGEVETTSGGYFVFNEYIAPGTYNMTISKANYLSRTISVDIKASEEFNISLQSDPIYLYPGEMTGDNMINTQDVNYYVSNWLGIYDPTVPNFSSYNFDETYGYSINGMDLEMILMRKDWVRASYPKWTVPNQ